ncbi:MAG: hypothetical protein WC935_09445 [Thermoleophilia bacterium]
MKRTENLREDATRRLPEWPRACAAFPRPYCLPKPLDLAPYIIYTQVVKELVAIPIWKQEIKKNAPKKI